MLGSGELQLWEVQRTKKNLIKFTRRAGSDTRRKPGTNSVDAKQGKPQAGEQLVHMERTHQERKGPR